MNQLYNLGVQETNRKDLVAVLLTGVNEPKLNYTGPTLADMLRVNLSIPVTPSSDFSRLGVLGGDLQGFPNGRRLGDDVVDIAERAVAGALIGKKVPLGDGVDGPDRQRLRRLPVRGRPRLRLREREGQVDRRIEEGSLGRPGGPSASIEPERRTRANNAKRTGVREESDG